jgi:hypothetical protein
MTPHAACRAHINHSRDMLKLCGGIPFDAFSYLITIRFGKEDDERSQPQSGVVICRYMKKHRNNLCRLHIT